MAIFKNELTGVDAILEAVNKKVESYNPSKEWFMRCVTFEGLPAKKNADNVYIAQKNELYEWLVKHPELIPKGRSSNW